MYEQTARGLQTATGEHIALQSVNVTVAFTNLLCKNCHDSGLSESGGKSD